MARQKLIHLHGSEQLTKDKAAAVNMVAGELAVMNGTKETSELYVITGDGDIATFVTGAKVGNQIDGAITTLKNGDIKNLSERIAAFETGNTSVGKQIESAITELTGTNGQVGKNTAAITILNGTGNGSVTKTVDDAVKKLADGQVATNQAAIATLNGNASTAGSVAKTVADAVTELTGTNGQVGKNTAAIATLTEDLGELSAEVNTYKLNNDNRVKAVEEDLAGYKTSNDQAVEDVSNALNNYKTEHDTEYAAFKESNTEAINKAKKAGTDAAAALDTHKNDKKVHVTEDLQAKWNTTSERLETFLGGDTLEDTLDTLHGIQEWMAADGKDASDILGAITQEVADRKAADEGLSERIAAFETGNTSVGKQIESAITELTGTNGQVGKNTAAITILNGTGNGSVTKTVADAVKKLADGQVATNQAAIATLNGNASTAGSVAKTVADAVTELTSANGQVGKNTAAITILNGTGDGSVAKTVANAISTLENGAIKNITDNFVNSGEIKGANGSVINGTVTNNKLSFDITQMVIDCGTY